MKETILFKDKKDCCGCSGCMNICPRGAITMKEDEFGDIYPVVDESKCIHCNLCKKVCSYQNDTLDNKAVCAYAATSKDSQLLLNSASGGIFASIASKILENNGVVYGCSMEYENDLLVPRHIRIDDIGQLPKIQGSKYVKSVIDNCYKNVLDDLKNNKVVLFTGTPCQVAALKKYLNILKINVDKLYCIDLICHGTPSTKIFQDYIKLLEAKIKGNIIGIKFRDKKYTFALKRKNFYKGTIVYRDKSNVIRSKSIIGNQTSYYNYFLNSIISRENCYSCKYAKENRVGDITIGDYWGIEAEHPDFLKENGGMLDITKGVSCIIVNNHQGEKMIELCENKLLLYETTLRKIVNHNKQLNTPSLSPNTRKKIMDEYSKKGYKGVEIHFQKHGFLKRKLHYLYYEILKGGSK